MGDTVGVAGEVARQRPWRGVRTLTGRGRAGVCTGRAALLRVPAEELPKGLLEGRGPTKGGAPLPAGLIPRWQALISGARGCPCEDTPLCPQTTLA